mgnify:CR=1 FL=1
MRIITIVVTLVLLVFLSGCAYVNTRAPYDETLESTELGSKVGTASNHSVLWLVAWGDGSYAAAAENGDIRVMKHADIEVFSVLFGAYVKRTILVYGD